jgi:phosphoribosylformylglycinamidine synthase
VVKKGQEATIKKICDKWDLYCAEIGVVTDTKRLRYHMQGELVADVPAEDLVLGGGAPVYHREYREPAYFKEAQQFRIDQVAEPAATEELKKIATHLATHPNICSRRWVAHQYDSMVGTATMTTNSPSDAAIVKVKGTDKAIAITVDCNSRYVNANPEEGCAIAVAEAARNIVCSGGEPVAITNCLNFGNPYVPEVYWQFVGAIQGMKKACEKFETPVTGGNVSFYNQSSDEGPVFPTPTIGMLGLLDNKATAMTLAFQQAGDLIYLLGKPENDISSSEYLYSYHGVKLSPAPAFDLDTEFRLQQVTKALIRDKQVQSAHDVSDGGLYIALLESAMPQELGFAITTDKAYRKDAYLFGESQSRIVVSVSPANQAAFEAALGQARQPYTLLGTVTDGACLIDGEEFHPIQEMKDLYDTSLEKIME